MSTHFFCAIRAFTKLELMRAKDLIENWHEVQRNLYIQVTREFIVEHLLPQLGGNTYNFHFVNAEFLAFSKCAEVSKQSSETATELRQQ